MTLDQIAEITGHASIRTVRRHYLVIEEKRARDNANKVAERIQQFRSKAS
jgi:integrase